MSVAAGASREVSGGKPFPAPKRLLGALSDERLANHLAHGHEAAFELLYDRHHRGLLGFCRHMLRSHQEAEDAVQQVFLAAYRAITEKGDRPRRVKPWLYAIGRNRCLEIIRSQRNGGPPLTEDAGTSASGPPEEAEQRADLHALLEDLRRLPEEQRSAIVLAELGGLAHREVAEVLECRPDKVRALVFQARTTLLEEREARGASCQEVRSRLANMAGTRLHGLTRRHVKSCAGCAGYYEDVRRQRRMLALVLPVPPSVGLKENVLAAAAGGAGGSGTTGAGAGVGAALKTGTAGGTTTGGGTVAAAGGGGTATTAGGMTASGAAAGSAATAATSAGAAGGATAGGAAAGATATGAMAGGGVLAAITAHAGVSKAAAVALAAGSVAAGAEVAKKTGHAEPTGERIRLMENRPGDGHGTRHTDTADLSPSGPSGTRSGAEADSHARSGSSENGPGSKPAGAGDDGSPSGKPTASPAGEAGPGSSGGSAGGGAESGSAETASQRPAGSSGPPGEQESRQGGGGERSDSNQSEGSVVESTREATAGGKKPVTPPQAEGASKQLRSVTDRASQKVEKLKNRP